MVTENVKDFAPLAREADESRRATASLRFTSSRTFPRIRRNPRPIIEALEVWLQAVGSNQPPVEDWLQAVPDDS